LSHDEKYNLIISVNTQSLEGFYHSQLEVNKINQLYLLEIDKCSDVSDVLKLKEAQVADMQITYSLQSNELNYLIQKYKSYTDELYT